MDWYRCRFLESCDNLRPLIKQRFGREPSATTAREIVACLQQGRLFYEAAETSPLEIRPLQLFYGMVGFAKALIVASSLRSLSSLQHSHGVRDISAANSRIADLRLVIDGNGTFSEFNDAVADLTRFCYDDGLTHRHSINLPSASSAQIRSVELSLPEILGRIPNLESLYQMTFIDEARTAPFSISAAYQDAVAFRLQIGDRSVFTDRASLKQIVERWRARFPFLKAWRLNSAQVGWGSTSINFENIRNDGIDEFSESFAVCTDGMFQASPQADDEDKRFILRDGLTSTAGYLVGGSHMVTPINGQSLYISEFSLHYLGLFMLSSLVRYRPERWARSISRSIVPNEPADDRALSLIEKFLNTNHDVVPEAVVTILNPQEDYFYG